MAAAAPIWLAVALAGCAPAQSIAVPAKAPLTAPQCVPNAAEVAAREPVPESTTATLPGDLATHLDTAAQTAFAAAAAPGAIVGVRTPQGTWTAAYGFADPYLALPMSSDMHTRIDSITAIFTGTVILQLAEEGLLSLGDTISVYYPGIPNGDEITLAKLANMTSGIADYHTEDFLEAYFDNPDTVFSPDELIAYGLAQSPVFEPGAQFGYSNTNTILLGKVIESVTGMTVQDVFQQRIYEPLGLTGTSLPEVSPVIPHPHPQGYTLQGSPDGEPLDATGWSPSPGWTAAGMISTLEDLLVFGRALGTGQKILSPPMHILRLESFPVPGGYGLAMACSDGWVGHTGELPGFTTTVYYDTTTDTSVVVMVNSDIASGACPQSPTLPGNPADLPCASPATRIFVGLSEALGHPFAPASGR